MATKQLDIFKKPYYYSSSAMHKITSPHNCTHFVLTKSLCSYAFALLKTKRNHSRRNSHQSLSIVMKFSTHRLNDENILKED